MSTGEPKQESSADLARSYAELAERFGATVPVERIEAIAARLAPRHSPPGTTDAYLAESRVERWP